MQLTEKTTSTEVKTTKKQEKNIQSFYKFHARIYDATRWTFLFGRRRMLKRLPLENAESLLEVGCGTGFNLKRLAATNDKVKLIGVDVSPEMLKRATYSTRYYSRRIFLFERPYAPGTFDLSGKVDLVLCSYSLSMFNPGWEKAIERAIHDLKPGGHFAFVDFHDTRFRFFRWWMKVNHVRMEAHILPFLEKHFETVSLDLKPAMFGLWRYIMYIGKKPMEGEK